MVFQADRTHGRARRPPYQAVHQGWTDNPRESAGASHRVPPGSSLDEELNTPSRAERTLSRQTCTLATRLGPEKPARPKSSSVPSTRTPRFTTPVTREVAVHPRSVFMHGVIRVAFATKVDVANPSIVVECRLPFLVHLGASTHRDSRHYDSYR